jgi:hypothetical protein
VRATRKKKSRKDRPNDLEIPEGRGAQFFGEKELYVWVMEISYMRQYLQAGGVCLGIIFMCCIKAWPLWLKIAVWWCSLIMLITLTSIFLVRVVLHALFWLVGFRDLWLFPNIFDDDIAFLEAFQPVFGIGMKEEEWKRHRAKAAVMQTTMSACQKKILLEKDLLEKVIADEDAVQVAEDAAVAEGEGVAAAISETRAKDRKRRDVVRRLERTKKEKAWEAAITEAAKEPSDEVMGGDGGVPTVYNYKFGILNLLVLVACGLLLCREMGVFKGENIPDFLASREELWNQYPSLAYDIDNTMDKSEAELIAEQTAAAAAKAAEVESETDEQREEREAARRAQEATGEEEKVEL